MPVEIGQIWELTSDVLALVVSTWVPDDIGQDIRFVPVTSSERSSRLMTERDLLIGADFGRGQAELLIAHAWLSQSGTSVAFARLLGFAHPDSVRDVRNAELIGIVPGIDGQISAARGGQVTDLNDPRRDAMEILLAEVARAATALPSETTHNLPLQAAITRGNAPSLNNAHQQFAAPTADDRQNVTADVIAPENSNFALAA